MFPIGDVDLSSSLTSLLLSISSSKLSFCTHNHLNSNEKGGGAQFPFSFHTLYVAMKIFPFLLCPSSYFSLVISVCPSINIWIFTSYICYPLSTQLEPGVEEQLVCTDWIFIWDPHSQLLWFLRMLWYEVCRGLYFPPPPLFFFILLFLHQYQWVMRLKL